MVKYSKARMAVYSIILLVALIGLSVVSLVGIGSDGTGSVSAIRRGLDLAGGVSVTYEVQDENPSAQDMEDTIYKLQKRVEGDSTESQVYQSGTNRITVEIPGVTNADEILQELGTPGSLEFLDSTGYTAMKNGEDYTPLLTGSDVKEAQAYTDTSSSSSSSPYGVSLTFTDDGATKFEQATSDNVGSYIYIVYDGEVVSAPRVSEAISGGSAVITGMETYDAADNLATYIRIGAIPLTLSEASSNIVGAQLGSNAIHLAKIAAVVGLIVLAIFMIALYRIPGVVAMIALWLYLAMEMVILSAYQLTLTLPGIAGIILGLGMAVDANIIIYSRIKEEIGLGRSVDNAIGAGYHKAMSSIVDGNVTTIIAGIVLEIFGSGTIKGFATTLILGNVLSMFTAFIVTRTIMRLFYNMGLKDPKFYGKTVYKKEFDFLKVRKKCYILSAALIASGFVALGIFKASSGSILNFSIEFAGGSETTFTFDQEYTQEEIESEIIPVIQEAAGIAQVQQQKVKDSTQVTFKTSTLDQDQRRAVEDAVTAQFPIQDGTVVESDSISASVSSTMRRDALVAVVIALVCMLLYIWFRFRDIKFAGAAVIALFHDVLVVFAFYAWSRTTVGTTFIACMLTILGYSINATIIIFDRIRELLKSANSKTDITELVNRAITNTLQRSLNTNISTFIMLAALFIFGVSSVREFSAPLMVGVICGAYSSIFITSALWYDFGGKKKGAAASYQKKVKEKPKKRSDGAVV
ncbi:MAG: protein translocase subunit SecD [Lachnospiraceae bacterium]|nr:protein translocase subunit SecD [Lachnospiraceae bacterium]MCH4030669.1 protein translocase subunit SecD [Lachnospiraceae bacterium]MCH4069878.1 protein translocase subunit SecD [Lachnospiraceae bacterium]MCH4107183.1 protein translocase subunit SecD [Lachnospiraceae bacterium]MCI1301962.1 protein translocase subunit SecD [Lachnospiraceae bacterium]